MPIYIKRIIIIIFISIFIYSLIPCVVYADSSSVIVTFQDTNLEEAVRDAIHKPTGDIYVSDMSGINILYINNKDISSLSGLEYATNLTTLDAGNNQITDLTPISSLDDLTVLFLNSNEISDISPICSLDNIQTLELDNNKISNIPNEIANLTSLTSLGLSQNTIADVSPLANMAQLQTLNLMNNQISDISSLKTLTNLQNLILSNNHLDDISVLSNFKSMGDLFLSNCNIDDCSPLSKMINLWELILNNNRISDISPLTGLGHLNYLDISYNKLTENCLSTLQSIKDIKYINLKGNAIFNLDTLRANPFLMPNLVSLNLSDCNMNHTIPVNLEYGHQTMYTTTPGIFDPDAMAAEAKLRHISQAILNSNASNIENVLAMHDYVVKNTTYTGDTGGGMYYLLLKHGTYCSGYSTTFQTLTSMEGMDGTWIGGAGHAWNLVCVDGDYYHLDATWDDNFDTSYYYEYFLLSDSEIESLRSGPEFDWTNPLSGCYLNGITCTSTRFDFLREMLDRYTSTNRDKITIDSNYIYYCLLVGDKYLVKVPIDGGDSTILSADSCGNVRVDGDNIIFLNNSDGIYYSIHKDGTGKQVVDWLFPVSSAPDQCANIFPVDSIIQITFNENISISAPESIILTDTMGRTVSATCSAEGNVLSVKPDHDLLSYEEYSLLIPADSLVGEGGAALKADYNLYFSSAENPNDLAEPTVDHAGGQYTSDINVSISAGNADIHYTLDSTSPTIDSPKFTVPIDISNNTVLRYFAIDSNGNQSKVYTQVYILISKSYTVYFNSQGGSAVSDITVQGASTIKAPSVPTRDDYSFGGWYKDADCTDGNLWDFDNNSVTNNLTLYAKWTANTYIVHFNDSDYGTQNADISVTYDSPYGTLPSPSRTGYIVSWYTGPSGTGTLITGSTVAKTANDQTLYAKWTANTYTVHFSDTVGGTQSNDITMTYDSPYGTLPSPSRTGYIVSWYTGPSGTGTLITGSTVVKTANDQTLYAKWTPITYTVQYNINGGDSGTMESSSFTYNVPSPLSLNGFTRTDYTFAGWATSAGGPTIYTDGQSVKNLTAKNDATITLYAIWSAETPGANLLGIALSAGSLSPAFSQKTTNYTIGLGELDTDVMVTPVKVYDGATMTINGIAESSADISVANGKSAVVTIKVSYGKLSKTYKLMVKRPKSTDDNLSSLTVGTLLTGFDSSVMQYNVTLPEDMAKITVSAVAKSSLAKVTPPSKTYSLKNNQKITVSVKVRAQSGATKNYKITIYRLPSTNADLAYIKTSSKLCPLTPTFDAGTTSGYSVTLPANVSSMTISWKASSTLAHVTVNGKACTSKKITLQSGQNITLTIVVMSQAGVPKQYTINISRN